ncbi:MAG: methylenetetrahydrofolate reductase [Verrucomicrobiota bacterium]|jgi:hypothetical protein
MRFIRDIYAAKAAAKQPACVADPGCAGGYAEARASNPADAGRATDRKSEIETANTSARRRPACVAEADSDSAIAAATKLEAWAMDPNTSARRRPGSCFEFFPPKTSEGDRNLLEKHIPALSQARPDFCSVTYGAGGSTHDKTLMIADRIQRQHHLTAQAHLTCVNHSRDELRALLENIRAFGCKNILALRGDPPCRTIRGIVVS